MAMRRALHGAMPEVKPGPPRKRVSTPSPSCRKNAPDVRAGHGRLLCAPKGRSQREAEGGQVLAVALQRVQR